MSWWGTVLCRTEAIPKIAEIALNCMGSSAFSERFGLRELQKITRAAGGPLQAYKLGIRDFILSLNSIQKADRKFTRWVQLCRCLRRALLTILAVVSLFYQDLCPLSVHTVPFRNCPGCINEGAHNQFMWTTGYINGLCLQFTMTSRHLSRPRAAWNMQNSWFMQPTWTGYARPIYASRTVPEWNCTSARSPFRPSIYLCKSLFIKRVITVSQCIESLPLPMVE